MSGNYNEPTLDHRKRQILEDFFHWLTEKYLAEQGTGLPSSDPSPGRTPAIAAYYLSRVNPNASSASLQELSAYERALGSEVCRYAIDISLDAKKATWPYIRSILRSWDRQGVKCVADVLELEAKRDAARDAARSPHSRGSEAGNIFLQMRDEERRAKGHDQG